MQEEKMKRFNVAAMAQRPPSTRSFPNLASSVSRCFMPLSIGMIAVLGPTAAGLTGIYVVSRWLRRRMSRAKTPSREVVTP